MSQSYQYILPVLEDSYEEIALNQVVANNGNIILNGEYASALTGTVSFDYSVLIGIYCDGNLTGVNFTVIGTQNGVVIQEVIAGVNTDVAESTSYFDSITLIKVTGGGGTVSVGTLGTTGYLPAILINTEKGLSDLGYALQFIGAANSTATVYQSLGNIANSGQTYDQLIESQELLPIAELADGTVTIPTIVQMKSICKNILVNVTNNQSALLTMRFLQL